jgi:hypothetical protein
MNSCVRNGIAFREIALYCETLTPAGIQRSNVRDRSWYFRALAARLSQPAVNRTILDAVKEKGLWR